MRARRKKDNVKSNGGQLQELGGGEGLSRHPQVDHAWRDQVVARGVAVLREGQCEEEGRRRSS